jgi:glycosyltransferase involved in cell wall biosynthesis
MVKGGAQENTLASAVGIHGRGWESALATGPASGPEGSLEAECRAAGLRMLRVPDLRREISPRRDQAALRQLLALIRKERPHVVHTHTSKAGILGRIAARRVGVPVVVHTPHGHVFHGYGGRLKSRFFVQVERACARLADRLVALTDRELQDHLAARVGRREQWLTIHSGIDFRPFESARDCRADVRAELGLPGHATVLGTVSRLVPIKDPGTLLRALALLGARHPHLHLLMVGDGPLREELINQASALNLNVAIHPIPHSNSTPTPPYSHHPLSRVPATLPNAPTLHLLGLRRDVPRLLSAMDAFVLASLNEGMGRVLVEAMAMELPCVATRVSGIPDVVADGSTGLLVPPRNPHALARAISLLLDDPAGGRLMGCRGRQRAVPGFSVERMVEELEHLYRDLLQARQVPPGLRPRPEKKLS